MFNLGDLVVVTETLVVPTNNQTPTPRVKEVAKGIVISSENNGNGCYYIAFGDKVVYVMDRYLKKFE